VIGHIDAT